MSDYRIVVLQRGWVAVGKYSTNDHEGILQNASIIRRWGTSKGLGELAENGPLADTKLDSAGTIRFHQEGVVMSFDTEEAKWQK